MPARDSRGGVRSVPSRLAIGTKRLLDMVLAGAGLIVLAPMLLPLMLVLRFTGEGKVFYRQQRVGRDRKPFSVLKFATMLENSLAMPGGDITLDHDPRVLPVGRVLRKTKINELPQLWNVLSGDMSLVGPRPIDPVNFALFSAEAQQAIAQMTPGLTGVGALLFRNESVLVARAPMDPQRFYEEAIYPDKSRLEIWYYQRRSWLLDLRIMALTAWSIPFPDSPLVQRWLPGLPALISPDMARGPVPLENQCKPMTSGK